MKTYTLLFRLNITDKDKQPTPAQMNKYMEDWMHWINGIAAGGQLAGGGHHLSYSTARVIRGKSVSEGPYALNGEGVAGYIHVLAEDLDAATAIALKCPILDGDGAVEVRETAVA